MSACKQCGGAVLWRKTDGRWQCFQPDGVTVHWDTCSKRRMDQVRATGERFDTETVSGYRNSIHGTKLVRMVAKRDPRHKVAICSRPCPIPPWEPCRDCPEGLGVWQ